MPPPGRGGLVSRALRGAVGLGLALMLIGAFVYWKRDTLPEVGQAIRQASPLYLGAAMGVQILHLWMRAVRWRLLLSPIKSGIGLGNLFSTTVIGYFASTISPVPRIGEVIRPLLLAGRERISRSASLATIGVERILDMVIVIGFLAVYLMLFVGDLEAGVLSSDLWANVLIGMRASGVVLLVAIPVLFLVARNEAVIFRALESRFRPQPGGLLGSALAIGRGLAQGMAVIARPREALLALGSSVVVWLAIAAATWLGVQGMGLELSAGFPFRATLLLVPVLVVGVSTPTPGGIGGYHIIAAMALEQVFGASGPAAAATAIVLWLISIVPVAFLGSYFLWRSGVRMGDLQRMTEDGEQAAGSTGGA